MRDRDFDQLTRALAMGVRPRGFLKGVLLGAAGCLLGFLGLNLREAKEVTADIG